MAQAGLPAQARLLGQPRLTWRSHAIVPRSKKGWAMLLYLAVRAESVPRAELAELLWGAARVRNVRQELYRLRQLPGAHEWLPAPEPLRLLADSDLQQFGAAVEERRYGDALRLGDGPLLLGFDVPSAPAFSDWLQVSRRQYEDLVLRALRGHLELLERRAALSEGLDVVERILKLDPLDEAAYRSAMRLSYQRGDWQAALRYFESCRRMLAKELGVEPLGPTLELAQEIEHGKAVDHALPRAEPVSMPARLLRPPVLLGRQAEWAAMESAWREGKTIFLCGPPGVGKTRLMLDFARSRGSYILTEGRPGDEHLPYSSSARGFARALGRFPRIVSEGWVHDELARLLPQHYPEATAPPLESNQPRTRFMQAVWHLMDRLRGIVAALPADDIQYYDASSAVVGNLIAAHFAEHPSPGAAGMVLAFRKDEIPPANLQGIQALCNAGAALLIDLAPLEPAAIRELVEHLEVPGGDELAVRLHRHTGGNPMFALETLKSLYAAGELAPSSRPVFKRSGRVDTVIRSRFERLSSQAVRLMRAVAVAQPSASPDLLARVLDLEPLEVAEAMGELERCQVLSGERFLHDLLYETALADMPQAILTLLHRRTAAALVELDGEPERIAKHHHLAGEPEHAVPYWLEAARHFRRHGLHDGAEEMLRSAVAHAPTRHLSHEAQLELARVQMEAARYLEAQHVLEAVLSETPLLAHEARTLGMLAMIQLGEGHLLLAAETAAKGAEIAAPLDEPPLHRNLRLIRARIAHRAERHQEALDLLLPIVAEVRAAGPSAELVTLLSEIAALYDDLARREQALPLNREALDLARTLEAPHLQVMATNHLLHCLLGLGRAGEALAPAEQALKLGHYHFSDLLRINLVRAYLDLDQHDRAHEHALWLAEHSADAAIRAAAWARLAEIYARQERPRKLVRALDRAVKGLAETDFMRAHARVVIAVRRYGNARQREAVLPYESGLVLSEIPDYLREELGP